MKRLALIAGLISIVATAAMAQGDHTDVTLVINAYRVFSFQAGSLTFTINDGGFNGPYTSSARDYRVTANTNWHLSSAMSPVDINTILVDSFGTWSWASHLATASGSPGITNVPGGATVTLQSATSGHYLGPGGIGANPASMVVTIGP